MRAKNKPQYQPFVYYPGAPFPGPPRTIIMAGPVANNLINRAIFAPSELAWIDGRTKELLDNPATWVDTWVQLLGLRALGLKGKFVANTVKIGRKVKTTKGWVYNADFLGLFQSCHVVMVQTLRPERRASLAAELRKRPYEAEVLRRDHYTASVINGVLVENGGPLYEGIQAARMVGCAYCKRMFRDGDAACPHCGAARAF